MPLYTGLEFTIAYYDRLLSEAGDKMIGETRLPVSPDSRQRKMALCGQW